MSFRCFTGRYGERAARAGLFGVLVVLAAWSAAVSAQELLWFEGGRPRVAAWQAVDILQNAADDGLEPEDYDAAGLRNVLTALEGGASLPEADLAALDGAVTTALRRFLADLHFGRIDPRSVHANFALPRSNGFDPAAYLRNAVAAGRLREAVREAEPAQPFYAGLRRALVRYRELADDPPRSALWARALPPLPHRKLQPGEAWAGTSLLAERLMALGDLPATTPLPQRYEGAVVDGVRAFQARHGLAADGVIGRETLVQLDLSPAARVRQIGLNLERLRWTPLMKGPRMIVVNVPEFVLRAYELQGGVPAVKVRMKVIVGKALDTRTPIFAEEMRFIEFSPFWNVPPSIAQAEVVPRLKREPAWFGKQGFEFVAGDGRVLTNLSNDNLEAVLRGQLRIRQRPGPKNALGDIKFVFPNNDNIYLHHTPAPQLFARWRRDFSHGCIRVEGPVALARFVLQAQPDWDEARIREAMDKGKSATLRLREPLPVVIAYNTALQQADGRVSFFPDIYGHDALLDEALRKRGPRKN